MSGPSEEKRIEQDIAEFRKVREKMSRRVDARNTLRDLPEAIWKKADELLTGKRLSKTFYVRDVTTKVEMVRRESSIRVDVQIVNGENSKNFSFSLKKEDPILGETEELFIADFGSRDKIEDRVKQLKLVDQLLDQSEDSEI